MVNINAYWRLMRFDKPVGMLLLWFPTAWALWFANQGTPPVFLLVLFFSGTVLMRAAGCVMNDVADREIDRHVRRTRRRPLASGEVSLKQALILLCALLFAAALILIFLPPNCVYLALMALVITLVYPFCKRFLSAPQMVLGLAFSMGMPMAYIASGISVNYECALLFVINFSWIIAYDTMYAMADKADDVRIGVNSTAIYFAQYDRLVIAILQCITHGTWLYLAYFYQLEFMFYFFWIGAGSVLAYQQILISQRDPAACFRAFRISIYYGALMWGALYFIVFKNGTA